MLQRREAIDDGDRAAVLNAFGLGSMLDGDHVDRLLTQLDGVVQLQAGDTLYSQGDDFRWLYIMRSGSFKKLHLSEEGEQSIAGFLFPYEVFCLSCLGLPRHRFTLQALETSSCYMLRYSGLEQLMGKIPALQKHLFRLASAELVGEQTLMGIMAKSGAAGRLAYFLLYLSRRMQVLKRSETRLPLPMCRQDIGNFLGLTEETVSRQFAKFQAMELIDAKRREVEILNMDGLREQFAHRQQKTTTHGVGKPATALRRRRTDPL